jgi:hypothetical protein
MSTAGEEFYVGYLPHAPGALARAVRRRVMGLFFLVVTAAVGLAGAHGLRPAARFEYGAPVELAGTVVARPYPHLIVPRPGRVGAGAPPPSDTSSYALVAPFKHGAARLVSAFDGQAVRLRATLAYRDGLVVAEVEPGSVRLDPDSSPRAPAVVSLGRHTLVGEIVDSKCFFGVMNPGELKPHRACASRCISGGVPPVLCVRDGAGRASYLFLVSAEGAPVNAAVLDFVAEPVEITGLVERRGEELVLRADPRTYRRLE